MAVVDRVGGRDPLFLCPENLLDVALTLVAMVVVLKCVVDEVRSHIRRAGHARPNPLRARQMESIHPVAITNAPVTSTAHLLLVKFVGQ